MHGISTRIAETKGIPVSDVLEKFQKAIGISDAIIAHNIVFDEGVIVTEYLRLGIENPFEDLMRICTMEVSVQLCRLRWSGGWKYPRLDELHDFLFGTRYHGCHNALHDAKATARCFFELLDRGCIILEREGRESEK